MAEKEKKKVQSVDVACQFMGVSFTGSASIGVKIICKKLSHEKAMAILARSSLEVKLAEHNSDQGSFKWGEVKRAVVTVGDCHRISCDGIDMTFRLSFDKKSVTHRDLSALANTEGRLKAKRIGEAGEQNDPAPVGGDDGELV